MLTNAHLYGGTHKLESQAEYNSQKGVKVKQGVVKGSSLDPYFDHTIQDNLLSFTQLFSYYTVKWVLPLHTQILLSASQHPTDTQP